jgi:uncharacterized membrane protein YqaE (UPF0057 family)
MPGGQSGEKFGQMKKLKKLSLALIFVGFCLNANAESPGGETSKSSKEGSELSFQTKATPEQLQEADMVNLQREAEATRHENATVEIQESSLLPTKDLIRPSAGASYKKDQVAAGRQLKESRRANTEAARKLRKSSPRGGDNKILYVILAFLLPPLSVYLVTGGFTLEFWIDLILTLLIVWLGGVIYALIVIFGWM